MVSFERVFEVLDLPIEVEEAAHPNNPIITGDIKYVPIKYLHIISLTNRDSGSTMSRSATVVKQANKSFNSRNKRAAWEYVVLI